MEQLDVLIMGAGLSGVSAAWHLRRACPSLSFAMVEARERLGGTWDLFQYPGIRSDSDMYTLGYRFRPWREAKAIADGPAILRYIEETARESGIDAAIRYQHRVVRAAWSSSDARWTVEMECGAERRLERLQCRFLIGCTGYYDYETPHTPQWEGLDAFEGAVVHPQFWPATLNYADKRVVVIGSGATAVTLVPAMSSGPHAARHVTMLQRSPSYVASMPSTDPIADRLRATLPAGAAYRVTRWKNIGRSMFFYWMARNRADEFKSGLRADALRRLGRDYPVDVHFAPRYNPWDERLCIVPDGDLYRAIRGGSASIVTDQIARFDRTGIQLASGGRLDADVVVTATGLRMSLLNGVALTVDGEPFDMTKEMVYKGMMLSNLPNFVLTVGYTNASWTLKADLVAQHVTRLLRYMRAKGLGQVTARRDPQMPGAPVFNFTSGYVQRAQAQLPQQGVSGPWRLHQNYLKDILRLRFGRIANRALEFRPLVSSPSPSPR